MCVCVCVCVCVCACVCLWTHHGRCSLKCCHTYLPCPVTPASSLVDSPNRRRSSARPRRSSTPERPTANGSLESSASPSDYGMRGSARNRTAADRLDHVISIGGTIRVPKQLSTAHRPRSARQRTRAPLWLHSADPNHLPTGVHCLQMLEKEIAYQEQQLDQQKSESVTIL